MIFMTEKFRLESIVIEGFKGFTSPQEIKLNGKSTFVFGPNGWGKSSILEAVSWCMFGLDRENESEIRNRDYYLGDCRVEINLIRNKDKLKIIRKLRADSGKSDVRIVSPQGDEKKLTETFPQLRKLGGLGANVLFAGQGTAHRFVGDLNKFKDVIDAYLELDRLERLRKLLFDEAKDRKENHYEKQIKKVWSEFEKEIDKKIGDVGSRLKNISSNPPWESTVPPTESETKTRLESLYKDVCSFQNISPEDSISTLPMKKIIDKISLILESPTFGAGLEDTIKQKKSSNSSLEDVKRRYESLLNDINRRQNDKQRCEGELNNLLSTENEEKLKKRIESLEIECKNLLQELETALSEYRKIENNCAIRLPELDSEIKNLKLKLERLSTLDQEILKVEQTLGTLTKDISEDELTKQLGEAENKAGKLGEYFDLINKTAEYCSKHACTQCPICESNSEFLQKLSEKKNDIPEQISHTKKEKASLTEQLMKIQGTRSNFLILKNEKEDIVRSIPENPNQKMRELERERGDLIQQKEIAYSKKEEMSKEVPERREEIQKEIFSIKQTLETVTNLKTQIQNYETELRDSDDKKRKVEKDVRDILGFSADTEIDLKKLENAIINIGSEIQNLERELNEKTSGLNTYKSRLKELKREVDYHHLLKLSANLSGFKTSEEWREVEEQIKEYLAMLDSFQEIYEALGDAYTKAFNEHLTAINQTVCEVYKTLTNQVSYPDARVSQISSDSGSIEIVIEVGVSKKDIWRKPTEVLNEQAKNAVVLVPYFAFSELGMLQHDLDFLLIDDPSRSFDVTHLELLMKLLKSASDHAQLILVTHEKEKFEGSVRTLFGITANTLEVIGFEPESGPKIKEVSL